MTSWLISLLSLSCGLLLYASALAAYHQATPRGTLKALGFALLVAFSISLAFIQL